MSDLISLLSDSEDEEPPKAPVKQPRRKIKASRHTKVVELLSDSSDEEEIPSTSCRRGSHNTMNQTAESSKPNVAMSVQPRLCQRRLDFNPKPKASNSDNPDISRSSSAMAVRAKRTRSPLQDSKANTKPSPVAFSSNRSNYYNPDSDSESDDDSILQFESGLLRKKTTTVPCQATVAPTPTRVNVPPASSNSLAADSAAKVTPESSTKVPLPRASTESTRTKPINPYAKKNISNDQTALESSRAYDSSQNENSSSNFRYPSLFSLSKRHDDIRAKLIIWFWTKSMSMVQFSFDGKGLLRTVKRIVHLALCEYPIRSVDEYYGRYFNVGGIKSTSGRLVRQDVVSERDIKSISTPMSRDGRYYSIVEACLTAMLDLTNKNSNQMDPSRGFETQLANENMWVLLDNLIPEIDKRLKASCPGRLTIKSDADNGSAFYNEKSTRSAEYLQIKCLLNKSRNEEMPLMKQHTRRNKIFFELTLAGYQAAHRISNRTFPAPPGHYRVSNLETILSSYDNICLGVDLREGGGPANNLHFMCNKLDNLKIPYFVGTFRIGDYAFFSGNLLCPILIERKSAQDVAESIADGRWYDQKQRMYRGQYVFGYENSRIAFLIEGKVDTQLVTGGYVGHRSYNVDRSRFNDEIENLKSEGFDVLRSLSTDHSMVELSRWAHSVSKDLKEGRLKVSNYSLEQFEDAVKQIPESTDFARLAKYAMSTRVDQTVAGQSNGSTDSFVEVTDDSPSRNPTCEENTPNRAVPAKKQKMNLSPLMAKKLHPAQSFKSIKMDGLSYSNLKVSELKKKCGEFGLAKTGNKADLIKRLNGPRPPTLWLERRNQKKYVPTRHDTCATALLVGLYLKEKDIDPKDAGMTKEELYTLAESLDISKDPFSGNGNGGMYHYDGWSCMSELLKGDPALVVKEKGRFRLTRSSSLAGYYLAEQLHDWCHQHGNCRCHELDGF